MSVWFFQTTMALSKAWSQRITITKLIFDFSYFCGKYVDAAQRLGNTVGWNPSTFPVHQHTHRGLMPAWEALFETVVKKRVVLSGWSAEVGFLGWEAGRAPELHSGWWGRSLLHYLFHALFAAVNNHPLTSESLLEGNCVCCINIWPVFSVKS